jgi:S1-C subfamily serine protease
LGQRLLYALVGALAGALLVALLRPAPRAAPFLFAPIVADAAASPGVGGALASALPWAVTITGEGVCGAGAIIGDAGLILTARHVIEGLASPRVILSDGRSFSAAVVDDDERLDLALLSLEGLGDERLAEAPLGAGADIAPGEELYTVGCPNGMPLTASRGIASFVGRTVRGLRLIQSDLAIAPGNSGGPLIDGRGRLVGVVALKAQGSSKLGLSLPIEYAVERFSLSPGRADIAAFRRWASEDEGALSSRRGAKSPTPAKAP